MAAFFELVGPCSVVSLEICVPYAPKTLSGLPVVLRSHNQSCAIDGEHHAAENGGKKRTGSISTSMIG